MKLLRYECLLGCETVCLTALPPCIILSEGRTLPFRLSSRFSKLRPQVVSSFCTSPFLVYVRTDKIYKYSELRNKTHQ